MANDIDLSRIENELKKITDNTNNTSDLEKGLKKVVSKLDALKTIEKWTNDERQRKKTDIGLSDIDTKIRTLISHQTNIDTNTSTIATHIVDMSSSVRDATDYLKALKEHIVDGGKTSNARNSGGGTKSSRNDNIDTISKNVDEIKNILLEIRNNSLLTGTSGETEEVKQLRELMNKNARFREEEQKTKNDYLAAIRKKKKDRDDNDKKAIAKYEEEQKNQKKHENKKNKKIGAVPKLLFDVASSLITEKPSASKLADKGVSALSTAAPVWGAVAGLIKAVIDLGSKQDRATTEFARAVGGGRYGKVAVGESVRGMIRQAPLTRGYTAEAAYSAMTEAAEAMGRTTERLSSASIQSAIDLKRFGIGADAVNNFDTFGKSLEQTDKYFAKLYGEVSKKGLSFKNVSKAVNDNLKSAQSHTFANGLRGLQKMAETSTQLKYNMQQVFTLADKVSEIEGAISTAANLSVLGGQFAQFSNPMQLLYEGLNDTEALNDRIVKMFGGKAQWNSKTGQIDMDPIQRQFVKEAAKAAGLDPNEMLSLSLNEGKMRHIGRQIHGVDKDTAEYIKNIAEIGENGEAYVSINGKRTAVSQLGNEDKELLKKESNAKDAREGAKLGDIYGETMSVGETLDNILTYLQEQLGRAVFGIFNKIAKREITNQNIAQGEGEKELQQKRLRFYNEHAAENRGHRRRFAKEVRDMDEDDFNAMGMSPNGLNPDFRVMGTGILRGPSHFGGGIKGLNRGQLWEAEGNEFLINKQSSARYRNELLKIQNGTFNPYSYYSAVLKNDMSRHYNAMRVNPVNKGIQQMPGAVPVNGTIKVDIPQTITINIAGQGKVGDYDISNIVRQYVDSFMKEAEMRRSFGGFNKERFYNQSNVI